MLLAPFSLIETPVRRHAANRDELRTVPRWLVVWAIGGFLAIALFPFLRGDNLTGLSLPFWLVAAPLINIAWLSRARWFAFKRERIRQRPARSRRLR